MSTQELQRSIRELRGGRLTGFPQAPRGDSWQDLMPPNAPASLNRDGTRVGDGLRTHAGPCSACASWRPHHIRCVAPTSRYGPSAPLAGGTTADAGRPGAGAGAQGPGQGRPSTGAGGPAARGRLKLPCLREHGRCAKARETMHFQSDVHRLRAADVVDTCVSKQCAEQSLPKLQAPQWAG